MARCGSPGGRRRVLRTCVYHPLHSFPLPLNNRCHRRAHAAAAPWEAQNALDAAFVAYASISALRQQMKPDQRVHGIILGRDWTANGTQLSIYGWLEAYRRDAVIPDYAKLRYYVRAPTWTELESLRGRVVACFQYVEYRHARKS